MGAATSNTSNPFDRWSITHPGGIARVEMAGGYFGPNTPDGWAIDDLQFQQLPEPGAVLGLAGAAAVILLGRRRAV